MPFAFAFCCLQGKFLQLICEAMNTRVLMEQGSCLGVSAHGGCNAVDRSCLGSREVSGSQEVDGPHLTLLLQTLLGLMLFVRESQSPQLLAPPDSTKLPCLEDSFLSSLPGQASLSFKGLLLRILLWVKSHCQLPLPPCQHLTCSFCLQV